MKNIENKTMGEKVAEALNVVLNPFSIFGETRRYLEREEDEGTHSPLIEKIALYTAAALPEALKIGAYSIGAIELMNYLSK